MRTDPIAQRLARNLAELRGKVSLREMSARLGALGFKLLPSGVLAIERGTRRVDAGELVALAIALGVNPNRLLLPGITDGDDFSKETELAAGVTAPAVAAWRWACGDYPLPPQEWEPKRAAISRTQDFREVARPHDADSFDFDEMDQLRRDLGPVWDAAKAAGQKAGVPVGTVLRFLQFMQAWESFPSADGD
jgi:hypothetical protein